jgi:hypothetical protein
MKKFLIKILLFFSIFYLINFIIAEYLDKKIAQNYAEKYNWVFSHENQKFDLAVLGSSRAYNLFDLVLFESLTNLRGINLGRGGSAYGDNYLVIDKFLRNNNKIDYLYIEVDPHSLNSGTAFSHPFSEYLFLPFLNEKNVRQVFKDNVPLHKYFLWVYFPFTKYMEFNNLDHIKNFYKYPKYSKVWDKQYGSNVLTDLSYKNFKKAIKHTHTVSENSAMHLRKIIELAQENKIEVILYTAPLYIESRDYHDAESTYEFTRNISKEYHVEYFDYSFIEISNNRDYFRDFVHMNSDGVKLFTDILAKDFINNYKK